MPRYALIVEHEPGRAARYVPLVEEAGATAAVVTSHDQALSYVRKSGAPAMVLLGDTDPQQSAVGLLRAIRELVPGREVPAVIVAGTGQGYRLATTQSARLGLVTVLRGPNPVSAVDRAVRAALSPAGGMAAPAPDGDGAPDPGQSAEDGGRTAEVLPGLAPASGPDPEVHDRALDLAERLSEHPLVERLARLRVLTGETAEDLQRLVADTAEAFEAPMALVWLERAGRVRFAAHPRAAADASLRSSGGHWTALRDAFGETPLHVENAASHIFLAGNPLVATGKIRCVAGAPMPGPGGRSVGTIAVAASSAGGIPASILDPLEFWAHRVVSELPPARSLLLQPGRRRRPEVFSPTSSPPSEVTEALGVGVILSDEGGTVTFANAAASEMLAPGGQKLPGMRRTVVVSALLGSGAPEDVLAEISPAGGPEPRRITLPLRRAGARRILRWQTRAIRVDGKEGRLDEIVDVTSEGEEIEAQEDLVRIDADTGLANRRAGEEALAREIAAAIRGGAPLSVALFEVHVSLPEAAERAFREVAWLLRDALRGYDLVVCFAPRRLLAILPQARGRQAAALAERFRGVLKRTERKIAGATVSFGVAEFEPAQDVERLLSQAAAALDAAVVKQGKLSPREDA